MRYSLTSAGIVAATIALAVALGGCATPGTSRTARAETPAGARQSDRTGRPMSVLETDSAALRLIGWGALPARSPLLVGALPEPLRRLGIAGVVAPGLCGAANALVLDMPRAHVRALDALTAAELPHGSPG
ncbi:MAG: hypothetical protein WKG00_33020 [Polyangiaceae bacterium]